MNAFVANNVIYNLEFLVSIDYKMRVAAEATEPVEMREILESATGGETSGSELVLRFVESGEVRLQGEKADRAYRILELALKIDLPGRRKADNYRACRVD